MFWLICITLNANCQSLKFFQSRLQESNLCLRFTKALFYHLTKAASYFCLPFINKRPSFTLLLKTRFFLPFPLFDPAYVAVNESQFGQINLRLLSILFFQFPSI